VSLMRANKEFTVIPWKTYEEPKQHLHCKYHIYQRLLSNGFCPECGPTLPAVKTIILNNPSESASTQELQHMK
jgi:hypothetical protein